MIDGSFNSYNTSVFSHDITVVATNRDSVQVYSGQRRRRLAPSCSNAWPATQLADYIDTPMRTGLRATTPLNVSFASIWVVKPTDRSWPDRVAQVPGRSMPEPVSRERGCSCLCGLGLASRGRICCLRSTPRC